MAQAFYLNYKERDGALIYIGKRKIKSRERARAEGPNLSLVRLDIFSVGSPPELPAKVHPSQIVILANRLGCDRWDLRSIECVHDQRLEENSFSSRPIYRVMRLRLEGEPPNPRIDRA